MVSRFLLEMACRQCLRFEIVAESDGNGGICLIVS